MSQWILAPHWCPHQTDSKFPVNHSSVKSPDLVFPCTPSGNVSYRRIYNKIISLHPNEQVVLLINVVLNPENCFVIAVHSALGQFITSQFCFLTCLFMHSIAYSPNIVEEKFRSWSHRFIFLVFRRFKACFRREKRRLPR